MTASDPRVGEIQARLDGATKLGEWETTRANDVVIYDPNGFGAYRLIAHADCKQDAEFIAAAPAYVAYLLAELADRDAELARVADRLNAEAKNAEAGERYAAEMNNGAALMALQSERGAYLIAERLVRAAVAAAKGDGKCRRTCDCVNAPEGSPDCRYCDYEGDGE